MSSFAVAGQVGDGQADRTAADSQGGLDEVFARENGDVAARPGADGDVGGAVSVDVPHGDVGGLGDGDRGGGEWLEARARVAEESDSTQDGDEGRFGVGDDEVEDAIGVEVGERDVGGFGARGDG